MTSRFPAKETTLIILMFLLSGCAQRITSSPTMVATRNSGFTSTPNTAKPQSTYSPSAVPITVLSSNPTLTLTPSPTASPTTTPTATLVPAVAPPPGLIFSTEAGLWLIDGNGESKFLLNVPEDDWVSISSDASRALFGRTLLMVDVLSGQEFQLDFSDEYAMCCPGWWTARPNVVLVEVQPGEEMMGMGYRSIPAAVFLDGTNLRLLGEEPTSIGPFTPSPNGEFVAYDQGGVPWLYWWNEGASILETKEYGFPELTDLVLSHPAWSPDSNQLAWIVAGIQDGEWQHGVGLFDLGKKTSQFLYPFEVEGFDGGRSFVFWNPDQKHFALWNHGKDLLWVLSVDGAVRFFGPTHSLHEVRTFPWSSEGQWLVYAVYDRELEQPKISVTSVDGTETHEVGIGRNAAWSPDGQWLVVGNAHWRNPGDNWMIKVGTWERKRLDLPEDASIMDWIAVKKAEQ